VGNGVDRRIVDRHSVVMTFSGIPAEAFDFYEALTADNTKAFWEDHRGTYTTAVRQPLEYLGNELAEEFGTPRMFRSHRDIRFSKDKSPYKDHQGMYVAADDDVGWYVQISAHGLMVAGGWYQSTSEEVAAFRQAVETDRARHLDQYANTLTAAKFALAGEQLKSRPRGVAVDNPHLDWLRHRTLYYQRLYPPAAWMGSRRVVSKVRDDWRALTPLVTWLSGVLRGTHTDP
jgi:uncharacterized protein (TIGR02453 family)